MNRFHYLNVVYSLQARQIQNTHEYTTYNSISILIFFYFLNEPTLFLESFSQIKNQSIRNILNSKHSSSVRIS